MNYNITKVVRGLDNGRSYIKHINGEVDDSQYGSIFSFEVNKQGLLSVEGRRRILKRKNGDFAFYPLKLRVEDEEVISPIISHWQEIRDSFIRRISHGIPMGGYTGTTYIFPDGTKKEYQLEKYRKGLPDELKEHLPRVKGPSIDDAFPSNGCDYIENFPERQHYAHGRFDFYLEQDGLAIEDDETIQHFYQPGPVGQLLSFIAQNPEDAVYRLIEEKKQ